MRRFFLNPFIVILMAVIVAVALWRLLHSQPLLPR